MSDLIDRKVIVKGRVDEIQFRAWLEPHFVGDKLRDVFIADTGGSRVGDVIGYEFGWTPHDLGLTYAQGPFEITVRRVEE